MSVTMNYRLKEACRVVHDVSGNLWGFRVTMLTKQGEENFLVSAPALINVEGEILPTVKGAMRLSMVGATADYSGRTQMLRDLFARRFEVRVDLRIPLDIVARLCSIRYGKSYHIYKDYPMGDIAAVIAEKGSAIVGVDLDLGRKPMYLFKRRTGEITPMRTPFLLAYSLQGFTVQEANKGVLGFANDPNWKATPAELEYMLSHTLISK